MNEYTSNTFKELTTQVNKMSVSIETGNLANKFYANKMVLKIYKLIFAL